MNDKYINLDAADRFVETEVLRNSYLHYEDSLNPTAPNFISFESEGLELGIVSSQVPQISRAVSSVLSCSLEDAKYTNGGYLPPKVVERVQGEIISPYGVSQLWGVTGHRFVLSRYHTSDLREIVASILVGRSKDTIFFFTGRYNNIQHSVIKQIVDLEQSADGDPNHKWFDQFDFPELESFKPKFYHQIANFVVAKQHRSQGLARFLIENIRKYYSRDYLLSTNSPIQHSQHLLCGRGFWQIGDPPWLPKMQALGFYLRGGAESFFVERDWCPLPPVYNGDHVITNIEYNKSFGLPDKYDLFRTNGSGEHLWWRIPEVMRLSQDPRYKLQYFQAMYNFL